jgi:hypothetical protein
MRRRLLHPAGAGPWPDPHTSGIVNMERVTGNLAPAIGNVEHTRVEHTRKDGYDSMSSLSPLWCRRRLRPYFRMSP